MDEVVKRIQPHSLEAEQSVIGAMLLDRDAILVASEKLSGEDFYLKSNGVLFDTMLELFNEDKAVDEVTLLDRLKVKDVSPEIKTPGYLADLLLAVPTSANIEHYANIVAEKALLRRLIKTNEEIENKCYLAKDDVEVIMEETEKKIFNLVQNQKGQDYTPIREVVLKSLDNIAMASKMKGNITGVPTGFIDLDRRLSGLQPSDLILVAARPSMGKTAFVLNIAQHVAIKKNMKTVMFSLEMSNEQLVNRLFALESGVEASNLRNGHLGDDDWDKLVEGATNVAGSNLIIDDTPGITMSELRSKCRKYALDGDLKLIIIDYLQLITSKGKVESRTQEVSEFSRSLKALARELKVPVVALSQLSRQVESRPDKRPMLSDLRESGAIEQDADVVMFIYRDDYYNKDTAKKGVSEIIVAKQRNGPIGTTELAWIPEYTKFGNLQY